MGVASGASLCPMARVASRSRASRSCESVHRGLDAGSTGGGTAGITSDGPQLAWAPPCSQGPGAKQYTFTLYALSAMPVISNPPRTETGAALAADIAPVTLDQAQVTVSSTRP